MTMFQYYKRSRHFVFSAFIAFVFVLLCQNTALTALSDVDNDEETRKILSTLSLRQLETRVAQALDDLQNAQNDLASYNSQLVSLQTQPERVQNAMYNASQQLQQIRSRLAGT